MESKKSLSWDKKLDLCLKYERDGNEITSSTKYKEVNIGNWLDIQKENYNKNELSEEKKNKLIQLKYWRNWLEQKELAWNEKLYLCLEYEQKGFQLSEYIKYKEVNIGNWINIQKEKYKKQKLSEERTNKLNQLKYWINWKYFGY